jgi:hypothetical protein
VAGVHPAGSEADLVEVVGALFVEHDVGAVYLGVGMAGEVGLPGCVRSVGRELVVVVVPDGAVAGEPGEVRAAPVRVAGRMVAVEAGQVEDVAVRDLDRDARRTGADVAVLAELERQVGDAAARLV